MSSTIRIPRSASAVITAGALIAGLTLMLPGMTPRAHAAGSCGTTNLALNHAATSSSIINGNTAANAVDGNTGTRWESQYSDPQWLQVDLGSTQTICQVSLNWETASGKAYQIQTSPDGTNWTSIYTTTTGPGGNETLSATGSGRYIRMNGTARNTGYGYSLWEFAVYGPAGGNGGTCGTTNAALHQPATSSTANGGNTAANAVDGNTGTRWESAFSDPQWLQVDLGSSQNICQVVLNWETASGKAYQIQTSPDGTNWTPIYTTTTGPGGTETLNATGTGRYIRMNGTTRNTGYGYSLWEFQVFTTGGGTGGVIPTSDTPDFGPNVQVFDPSTPTATVQAAVDTVFNQQQSNQFGPQRNALLFKPGSYAINAQIGFNTQIAGLGLNPDDVKVNYVTSDAGWNAGNATQNFWREVENMAIPAPSGLETWAVSQGASMRRVDVTGKLKLDPSGDGWSSGGFLADSRISGQVASGSQQQWLSRNNAWGSWAGSNWNMVFVGDANAPAQSFPNPTYTTVAQTPVSREKPFPYIDSAGLYHVFVPALRQNSQGPSWTSGTEAGTSLPMHSFYVTKPTDSAATMNAALAAGLNLLITPGVYHLSQTLQVTRADTVVLGMGLATLVPDNGITAISTADVNGVQLAGLLIDAGTTTSATLVQMGPAGTTTDHSADPQSVEDVYFRIGGAAVGTATNSLVINAANTIGDNLWLWRADHGTGIGWTVNTADTGLVVNGANVTMYGLAVEHYQKYDVMWNGNGGRTYFFQNEMPYDPPNQAAWMNGTTRGFASYKVANTVTTHEAWGVGSYCYFSADKTIVSDNGFEAPNTAGVKFHDLVTVSLGGAGTIANVINNTGGAANSATNNRYFVSYP